jgi:hypothetical protein
MKTSVVKQCSKCQEEKSLDQFGNFSRARDGKKSECKKCISLRNKRRYAENEEKLKNQVKKWQEQNPDKVQDYKDKYNNKNKEKL